MKYMMFILAASLIHPFCASAEELVVDTDIAVVGGIVAAAATAGVHDELKERARRDVGRIDGLEKKLRLLSRQARREGKGITAEAKVLKKQLAGLNRLQKARTLGVIGFGVASALVVAEAATPNAGIIQSKYFRHKRELERMGRSIDTDVSLSTGF